jgi:hypothetical protein
VTAPCAGDSDQWLDAPPAGAGLVITAGMLHLDNAR